MTTLWIVSNGLGFLGILYLFVCNIAARTKICQLESELLDYRLKFGRLPTRKP